MTKKTRTILFLICLFLFLVFAPAVVFYSQGYRFDFENKKISQTGAFYFKVSPKSAEIYLDGKLAKKTDFIFGSGLIEELLPKKYEIEIKKDGYLLWQKNLEIKEKEVTEVKNIVLIPENPSFNILTKGIEDFWFSPDEKKIILNEVNKDYNPPASSSRAEGAGPWGWALKLYDLEKNVKSHLVEEKGVSQEGADFLKLEWSQDSKEIYLDVATAEQEKSFILKLDEIPPVLTEKEITPTPENIITSQTFNNNVYYLDNSGHLFKVDERSFISTHRSARVNEERLTEKPFPIKAETEYKLNIFGENIFLREGSVLYLFNFDSKSFEKIFEPIKELIISPDLKKLAFFNNNEIWILFLKDKPEQPQKKAGDKLFIARFSEKISQIFWYTNDYLVFNSGNKIKITEIDDRDRINIVDIAEFEEPKIFWNKTDKKLFILTEGNLYASETLFP